jgi:hypothetical protein
MCIMGTNRMELSMGMVLLEGKCPCTDSQAGMAVDAGLTVSTVNSLLTMQ